MGRLLRESEVNINWDGGRDAWGVDLSPDGAFRTDCVWWFRTRRDARAFRALVDAGHDARRAAYISKDSIRH